MPRFAFFTAIACVIPLVGVQACVGDAPSPPAGPSGADAGATPEGGQGPDGAIPDGATGDAGGDAGPRCDPSKPFASATLLQGISTASEEMQVWVSADELTAYVAVAPSQSTTTALRKSTRTSRDAAFSAPRDAPELANVNAGGGSVGFPSLTADGLVMMMTRDPPGTANDGVAVSIRGATSDVFPAPVLARTRASAIGLADAFLVAKGESLFFARGGGASFDLDEAARDVAMIYGDGGFVDYAPAPNVANVNDPTADDRHPVVSSDMLTLVFASNRTPGGGANTDLYLSSRAGPGGVFTAPVRLAEPISSNAADSPGTLTEDGCALYFTSKRAGGFGGWDVYLALRSK